MEEEYRKKYGDFGGINDAQRILAGVLAKIAQEQSSTKTKGFENLGAEVAQRDVSSYYLPLNLLEDSGVSDPLPSAKLRQGAATRIKRVTWFDQQQ